MRFHLFLGSHCLLKQRFLLAIYRRIPRALSSLVVRVVKPTYPIGVVAVVFNTRGEVLVLQHTYHTPTWRLPGGLLDHGESMFQTVVREVWEEANCKVAPMGVVDAALLTFSLDVAIVCHLEEEAHFRPNAEVAASAWWHLDACERLGEVQHRFVKRAYEAWGQHT